MSDLVKSISISNLLNQIEGIEARLIEAKKALEEAEEISKQAKLGNISSLFSRSNSNIFASDGVVKASKELHGLAWQLLMNESGLKTFMSAKKKQEWNDAISDNKYPELSRETIAATFRNIHSERESMFETGVVECFRQLSWDYKTNRPCKFGKKIIVSHIIDSIGCRDIHTCNRIDDLLRIFHVLDGKPEPDHRQGVYYQLSERRETGTLENDYIAMKWFKKGTGHIWFKRADLVKSMNKILAKYHSDALPRKR